jgi:hypothetical protein
MQRGTFRKQPLEEIVKKQAIKREKMLNERKSLPAPKVGLKRNILTKKRVKKVSAKSLHDKVWKLCREIIILLYGNTCYSTGKGGLEGSGLHCGHMLAKASLPLKYKYDLCLLRPQSYHANINLGGDYPNYLSHWLDENKVTYEQYEEFRKNIKQTESMGGKDAQIFLQNKIVWLTEVLEICKQNENEEWLKDAYTRYII